MMGDLLAAVLAQPPCIHGTGCRECAAARSHATGYRQTLRNDSLDAVARLGEWILLNHPDLVGQGHACDLALSLLESSRPGAVHDGPAPRRRTSSPTTAARTRADAIP